jgi:CYTH domain-containing protein/predicted ATPase
MHKPIKIALCGGPGGGKTSALPFVKQQLESRGFAVYTVPETATLIGEAGIALGEAYSKSGKQLQTIILKMMMQVEDSIMQLATLLDKPSVILCDRGVMDCRAFTYPPIWDQILNENNWSNVGLRSRYDAIFYMVTAADGARAFYTNKNNKVRSEDAKHAKEVCEKNRIAWLGHTHLRVFDNSTNFATKLSRLCHSVDRFVDSIETERRFLVNSADIDTPVETMFVEQIYLKSSDDKTERIRKRGQDGAWAFTRTLKEKKVNGSGKEIETKISELEYEVLKEQADPTRRPIFKKRNYFLWENQYFELDEFVDPFTGTLILEIELDDPGQKVILPPFLKIDREITEDPTYTNRAIAKIATATV